MVTRQRQIKTTLMGSSLDEFDQLCHHLGLGVSATVKLAVKRLAQSELHQNALYKNIAPSNLEEAA